MLASVTFLGEESSLALCQISGLYRLWSLVHPSHYGKSFWQNIDGQIWVFDGFANLANHHKSGRAKRVLHNTKGQIEIKRTMGEDRSKGFWPVLGISLHQADIADYLL